MSFTRFDDQPALTREQIAQVVKGVADKRGLEKMATIIALMTISTEVGTDGQWWCPANRKDPQTLNYPHDSESDDGGSSGYFQQQPGPGPTSWWGTAKQRMTLAESADMFLDRLSDDYVNATDAYTAGQFAQRVQGSAFPDRYAEKWDEAHEVYARAVNGDAPPPVESSPQFFPETSVTDWFSNCQSRNGRKPIYIVAHTQEGGGTNDSLINFMANAGVSYHYVIDNSSAVDVVDTSLASWSVLDYNNSTINFVFTGSYVAWSRNDWLQKMGNGIKIAAFIAARDCKRYGIDPIVRVGGSASGYATLRGNTGITDHNGITYLGVGNHTDVGPGFPWNVFNDYLQQFYNSAQEDDMFSEDDRALLREVRDALKAPVYSRSIYREPGEGPIGTLVDAVLNTDGMEHMELVERSAVLGDEDSLKRVIRSAAGKGAVTDRATIERAKDILGQVPAEILDAWNEANK